MYNCKMWCSKHDDIDSCLGSENKNSVECVFTVDENTCMSIKKATRRGHSFYRMEDDNMYQCSVDDDRNVKCEEDRAWATPTTEWSSCLKVAYCPIVDDAIICAGNTAITYKDAYNPANVPDFQSSCNSYCPGSFKYTQADYKSRQDYRYPDGRGVNFPSYTCG